MIVHTHLVEQLVADPGEQVVQDVVPAVGVELEQVLHDADLDLSTHCLRLLVQRLVRLHHLLFWPSSPTPEVAAAAAVTAVSIVSQKQQ